MKTQLFQIKQTETKQKQYSLSKKKKKSVNTFYQNIFIEKLVISSYSTHKNKADNKHLTPMLNKIEKCLRNNRKLAIFVGRWACHTKFVITLIRDRTTLCQIWQFDYIIDLIGGSTRKTDRQT